MPPAKGTVESTSVSKSSGPVRQDRGNVRRHEVTSTYDRTSASFDQKRSVDMLGGGHSQATRTSMSIPVGDDDNNHDDDDHALEAFLPLEAQAEIEAR